MKKFLSIILTAALMASSAAVYAENDTVSVKFNDELMELDVNPVIENDRTLVPFRAIFEALGCSVTYTVNGEDQVVTAKKADDTLMLIIGEEKMYYCGEEIVLDAPSKILNDRTLVPLRAVSEAFDADVDWDADTRTALVYSQKGDYEYKVKTHIGDIKAEDGVTVMNRVATYPVFENPENDEFIATINGLNEEFVSGFLYADDELEAEVIKLYEEAKVDPIPMELSSSFTVDTNKNGFLSITHHTCTQMHDESVYYKESIVWDMENKKQLSLSDILIGELDTEVNQTVFDAFLGYYEENHADVFDAEMAEKLGEQLDYVRFRLTDNSVILYFNPGQVMENDGRVQQVEIKYSEKFFKIKLDADEAETEADVDAEKAAVLPLPVSVNLDDLNDCTLAIKLEEGNAYVDDNGAMQMKVTVYTYDLYDMVDVAGLEVGDTIVRLGEEVAIDAIERNDIGTVLINGGEEKGGFDLYTDEDTVFYVAGMNDAKEYYEIGEAIIPVSTEFIYRDESDLENDAKEYYPGDFLTDDAGIEYYFTPYDTSITISEGKIVEMVKVYIP